MREEVEAALQEDGWTQASIGKLSKADSFVKESLRSSVVNTCRSPPSILNAAQRPVLDGLKRQVMKDYTFSDGTTIPAGNIISVPMLPIHLDPVGVFSSCFTLVIEQYFIFRRFTAIRKLLMASGLRKCAKNAVKMPNTKWRHLILIILHSGTVVKHGM